MTTVPTPGYAGFARLYWMFVGPMLAALAAYQLARQAGGWVTPTNIAFLLLVASLPAARWLEFCGGSPRTSDGDPATPADLRRYALVAPLVGLGVWLAANALGHWLAE